MNCMAITRKNLKIMVPLENFSVFGFWGSVRILIELKYDAQDIFSRCFLTEL